MALFLNLQISKLGALMKKLILLLLIILCSSPCFAKSPQKYVEEKYGSRAVVFDEDISDNLDDDKIGPISPIYFYNSTNHDITFEFHEIKTAFGNVKSDKIFPIRGRTKKITVKANQYFDTAATVDDIEHFVFIFEEEKPVIYTYSENMNTRQSTETNGLAVGGTGGITSSTEVYYSLVFEFADE